MPCNCHTSSLRVFVQSLTRVQVSGPSSKPTGFVNTKSFGVHYSNDALRSFTSTSAARFPRYTLRDPARGRETGNTYDEQTTATLATPSSIDTTASQPSDVSASDIKEAKNNHAIFDLSSESISALASKLPRTAKRFDDGGDNAEPAADPTSRHKQEFSGSSRLKRSKIIAGDKKPQGQVEVPPRKREVWQIQKEALKEKFPEGWNPRKKLSPDALDGIRALHTQYPQIYTTGALASQFQVSPEAIRRILKSKWRPSSDEEEDRQQRWFNRGKGIWSQMAELGTKPPKKWRAAGITRDARFSKPKGHRMEYPYVPKWKEKESAQKRLGDNLL